MRPIRVVPLLLALMGPSHPGAANPPILANTGGTDCAVAGEATVAGVFGRLNAALASRNAEDAARVFVSDAVLLAHGSITARMGRAEIRGYFEQLLPRFPQGTVTSRSLEARCNSAIERGTYVWRLTGTRMGTRTLVHASFNTEYVVRDGEWLIARHTASELPAPPLAPRSAARTPVASR